MAKLFPYASEPHPVWSPLAEAIHEAVWDRVGLAIVQGFVGQWADDRDEASRKQARAEAAERIRVRIEVVDHWAESLGLPRADCYGLLPKALDMLTRPSPELPLPPDHDPLSPAAKWAGLAAIHDVYWKGDKINPWLSLPSDGHLELWLEWEGWDFSRLLDRVGRLKAADAPFIARWLKDVEAGLTSRGPSREQSGNDESPANPPGTTAAVVDPQPPAPVRIMVSEPKPEAFRAYWLYRAGYTQQRIAEMLLGSEDRQGTISKWVAKVEEWKAAGNAMPEISEVEPLDSKPVAMDPEKLEQGPRPDHRPEGQRAKLAEMHGHGAE